MALRGGSVLLIFLLWFSEAALLETVIWKRKSNPPQKSTRIHLSNYPESLSARGIQKYKVGARTASKRGKMDGKSRSDVKKFEQTLFTKISIFNGKMII